LGGASAAGLGAELGALSKKIYVAPNARTAMVPIVRSARRVYISGVANDQTTIFALASDGRKIATIKVSVGRDVGELSALLNAAAIACRSL
jgi:Flp pilus assembly secretin CpaC